MKQKTLFIDSNIIYNLCDCLADKITTKYVIQYKNTKGEKIYLSEMTSENKNPTLKEIFNKQEKIVEELEKVISLYNNQNQTFVPQAIKIQTLHKVGEIIALIPLYQNRLTEYLYCNLRNISEDLKKTLNQNVKIPKTYLNILLMLKTICIDKQNGYHDSQIRPHLENYLTELTRTLPGIKKDNHSNDRGADENFVSYVIDSAFQGNKTTAFSADCDIKKILSVGYLLLKNCVKITNHQSIKNLINIPPKIAIYGYKQTYAESNLSENISLEDYLNNENISHDKTKLGALSNATITFLSHCSLL